MSMTHVYQPVMIKTLLESGNCATVDDIAKEFINWDYSLLEYYKRRVMVWPKRTLTGHKIVSYSKNVFTLLLDDDVTPEQKRHLVEICDGRTDQYVENYPDRLGTKNNRDATLQIQRYDIMARAKGICAACGCRDKALDVDHILPVNKGGTDEASNLQALCFTCNRQKRDRDKTDFVMWAKRLKDRDSKCALCNVEPIKSNELTSTVRAVQPRSKLHSLVFPKRHVGTFFDMIPAERNHCLEMVSEVREEIMERDDTVRGFCVNFDSGNIAGKHQHCHIHVIPSY